MSQRNLLILLAVVAVSYACYVRGGQNPYTRYVAEGLETIDQGSLDRVPERELFDGAMRGMVDVLERHGDQHSEYLNREQADPLRTEIRQQFGGIGVRIGLVGEPPQLTIMAPPEQGSPAALKNLREGDRILAIDGEATQPMSMSEVLRRMRGLPGTVVTLAILQENATEPETMELVREVINIESVHGDRRNDDGSWEFMLLESPRIAYIRISTFGERTAMEMETVLENVIGQGADGVVLDLRDNPGGSLDASVDVCRLLLPAGKTVVQTRGRESEVRQHYQTTEDGRFLHVPFVVLVNQNSASAAEIVAACLQDHRRAAVAGQRSHGKGTVQQLIPLESGKSLLKLTWASFWRPSNAQIHRDANADESAAWGVTPDAGLELKLSADEHAALQDYRSEREMLPSSGVVVAAKDETKSPAAAFVDRQLSLAVKHLQSKLERAEE